MTAISDVDYRREIMMPLQTIVEKGDMGYVTALLRYYTQLLSRWAAVYGKCFLVGSTPSPLYVLNLATLTKGYSLTQSL